MIPVKKKLGYGGSATIGTHQVLITSGGFEKAVSIPYLNMINTPPDTTFAGRVKHADGTNGYTGSLSFDVYDDTLSLFETSNGLLERYYEFDIGINDGENDWKMEACKLTSMTISGSEGGLVNAQISFLAKKGMASGFTANNFIRDEVPIGYWYTGTGDANDKVKDWSLAMTQEASIVYKNEDSMEPAYIKVGLVTYVLSITSFTQITTPSKIKIATKNFTLTGDTTGMGFAPGGLTGIGTYSYTFETSAQSGDPTSDALVIT
jgi:hypothetical protein